MLQAKEKLFNDLIIFLTVCPNGLGLTEVEIVLRMLPSDLTPDVKARQISFYMDLFRELRSGEKYENQLNADDHKNLIVDQGSEHTSDLLERQETLCEVIKSLIEFTE